MKSEMKRGIFLCMVLALLAGSGVWGAPGKGGKVIAVCLPALDNPLMLGIGDQMKKTFDGYDVQVSSADSDANKQVAQIQNYTTMKVALLVVMPVEASSVEGVLIKARQAGIKVFVTGTKLNEQAYDAMATVNQYLVGGYCAYMTKVWVDKNFPNAAPGSIQAAILTTSLNTDGVAKSNGLRSIAEPYLKNQDGKFLNAKNEIVTEANRVPNPAYCPKLKIVQVVDAEMFQAAQTAMQNILTTNRGVRIVLCCTSDGGGGVSQTYMDSSLGAAELKKVGVFGCGFIGPEADLLAASDAGKGVFRGAVSFGGGDLPGDMARTAKKVFDGSIGQKDIWDPIGLVRIKDGKIEKTAVNNTGVITAVAY